MKKKMIVYVLTLVLLFSCCPLWTAAEEAEEPALAAASETANAVSEEEARPAEDCAPAAGFAALPLLECDGCTTVITDLDGMTYTFQGSLDVTALEEAPCCEDIASYRIYLNGDLLLETELHDIHAGGVSLQGEMSNGYYSIQFDLNGTQEVFLTGLTPENLSEVQRKILSAGLAGEDFSFEDIDFIDTEKHLNVENLNHKADTDKLLCWAAATANILHYTGWGQQAGFGSTDYLFDLFTTRFSDGGGTTFYGLHWFFNGYYTKQRSDDWAQVDDGSYGAFLGYFPDCPSETVTEFLAPRNNRRLLTRAAEALRKGCGTELGITYFLKDGSKNGGHAITLWGYVRDKNDPDAFSYLIVSDSDDNKHGQYDNRRSAPNTLLALGLEICTLWGEESWAFSDNNSEQTVIIDELTLLAPYSEDLPRERTGDGNRFTHPDLTVQNFGVDTCRDSLICDRTLLPAGQELFAQYQLSNFSEVTAEPFDVQIQIKKDGVLKEAISDHFDPALNPGKKASGSTSIGRLDAGDYTITLTLNPDKSVREANYLNNTKTASFSVVDSVSAGTLAVTLGDMGLQVDGSVGAAAGLTCPQDCPANAAGYSVFIAYGGEQAESGWIKLYDGKTFPTRLFIERGTSYSNVYFRLLVRTGDPTQPWREYLSGATPQKYRYFEPVADEGNVFDLTARPQGSEEYAAGESTRFHFCNKSKVPGSQEFYWRLWAKGVSSEDWYCLATGRGELEPQKATETLTNASLSVIDPKTGDKTGEELPPDRYNLYAVVSYTGLTGETESNNIRVGTIAIIPTGELPRVATGEPVAVDTAIAAVPVSAKVEPGSKVRLGIEYSTVSSFTSSALRWATNEPSESNGAINSMCEIVPMLPDTTYYYRAVLEVQEGDGVRVYRAEDVKSLKTEVPDRLETLTLDQTLTFSAVPLEWNCFVFTAPESGWYHITAFAGTGLDYFVEGDAGLYSNNGGDMLFRDGKAEFTREIPAGRKLCVFIISKEQAACTVAVSKSAVTDYAAKAPSLTESGSSAFLASAAAAVPLGSSFALGVEYGPDADTLTAVSKTFTDWGESSAEAEVQLDVLPGRTYVYRAFVRDAETGDTKYSAFQTVQVPPCDGAPLSAGTQTFALERNEVRSFYSFTAETAGTYTVRIDGPDGVFTYWDDGWKHTQFTLNGCSFTIPLAAGETAYFTVKGYLPGEYHISYAFTGVSRLCDENGFGSSFTADQNGLCFAAAYDADGRMLAVRQETMTAGQQCTVYFPRQTGMTYMKVFRVSETLVPLCPPAVIE